MLKGEWWKLFQKKKIQLYAPQSPGHREHNTLAAYLSGPEVPVQIKRRAFISASSFATFLLIAEGEKHNSFAAPLTLLQL